jgi:hypothetical protein
MNWIDVRTLTMIPFCSDKLLRAYSHSYCADTLRMCIALELDPITHRRLKFVVANNYLRSTPFEPLYAGQQNPT